MSDPTESNETPAIYPIGKAVIGAVWLFGTASFFAPVSNTSAGPLGRNLFLALALTHVITCLGSIGTLRRSDRPLVEELWQTFLFGIVHVSTLREEQASESSGKN